MGHPQVRESGRESNEHRQLDITEAEGLGPEDQLAAEEEHQEDPTGDQPRHGGGSPVGPGPCQRPIPRGDECQREGDHPTGKHDEIEDVARLQVEPQHLDQDRDVERVDEEERLNPQLEREQEEEPGRQHGHDQRVAGRLLELDLLDTSQPSRYVIQGHTHHGAADGPADGEKQVAHELRRPTTARSSAARIAASGGA